MLILIYSAPEGVNLLNQVKGKFPRSEKIDSKIVNKHDWCCQFSVNGHDLLFGKLISKDKIDEPYF